MDVTRRNAALVLVAGAATASCAPGQQINIESLISQLGDVITKIQAGAKSACNAVPTARSVVMVLLALAGTNIALAALAGLASQAIDFIAKACPTPSPPILRNAKTTVNGKDIDVEFY